MSISNSCSWNGSTWYLLSVSSLRVCIAIGVNGSLVTKIAFWVSNPVVCILFKTLHKQHLTRRESALFDTLMWWSASSRHCLTDQTRKCRSRWVAPTLDTTYCLMTCIPIFFFSSLFAGLSKKTYNFLYFPFSISVLWSTFKHEVKMWRRYFQARPPRQYAPKAKRKKIIHIPRWPLLHESLTDLYQTASKRNRAHALVRMWETGLEYTLQSIQSEKMLQYNDRRQPKQQLTTKAKEFCRVYVCACVSVRLLQAHVRESTWL